MYIFVVTFSLTLVPVKTFKRNFSDIIIIMV